MDRHRLKIYDDEHLASFLFSLCWLPNLGLSVAVIFAVTSQASDLRPTTRVQHVASHFPFRSEILYGYSPTCIKRGSDNASISVSLWAVVTLASPPDYPLQQKVRREESLHSSSSHRACLKSPWPFTRATAGQRLSHVTYSPRVRYIYLTFHVVLFTFPFPVFLADSVFSAHRPACLSQPTPFVQNLQSRGREA